MASKILVLVRWQVVSLSQQEERQQEWKGQNFWWGNTVRPSGVPNGK